MKNPLTLLSLFKGRETPFSNTDLAKIKEDQRGFANDVLKTDHENRKLTIRYAFAFSVFIVVCYFVLRLVELKAGK